MSILPFLQPKKAASVIIAKRAKDGSETSAAPADEHSPALISAAEGLISALHAKDAAGVATHLSAAMAALEPDEANDAQD